MKIRNGFVANSSSSSYICDVCNRVESGWDLSLSDVEMMECEVGHIFCADEAVNNPRILPKKDAIRYTKDAIGLSWISEERKKELKELLDEILLVDEDDWEDFYHKNEVGDYFDYDGYYAVPSSCCPICTMKTVPDYMKLKYILKKNGITKQELEEEVKGNFENLEDFQRFIEN